MILPWVLLISLLGATAAPPRPLFSQRDGKISVKFPNIPGVDAVHFTYAIKQGNQHEILSTKSVIVHRIGGYYQCEFTAPGDGVEYSVKYMSNAGDVLYQTEATEHVRIAGETSLSPRLYRRGTTVLHDEFNSNHLDTNNWHQEITCWGGGNGEFQMYTPEAANTFIRNGVLYLKPTYTADKFGENFLRHGTMDVRKQWAVCTSDNEGGCYRQGSQNNIPPIMSSKMTSKASITHGKVEVVAQLPKGDWLWPAIWMLPPGWPWKYGGWPASGEIDIMEARGNLDLKDHSGYDQGINVVYSTIHWGPDTGRHRQQGHWRTSAAGTNWAAGFHTYTLDWTADHIRMDVDNQPVLAWSTPSQGYWSYSNYGGNNLWGSGGRDAPFDGKMSLILNVAVGSSRGWFQDSWINTAHGKPWRDGSPTAMMDFWNHKGQWQPTWHGDDVAMKIKSVKLIQY
ncbi:beta-1,3-glucan-binding protein-like [Haliotis rufescens]|uniref:beta-1,3-glucan-binding protein-like n=1 Tax=Haliotis rufescens TaxID=6454 RepID=UPI001EB06B53|nr:beta-1,3-glucan-binding protein-like [Haliotis rufescens]